MAQAKDKKTVLILGATGTQGGAVLAALEKDGSMNIRCGTRNVDSDKAKALKARGWEIMKADINDMKTLGPAMKGVWAVVYVSIVSADETKVGICVVDCAIAAKVSFFVFQSVASSHLKSGVGFFDAKYVVEQHIEKNKAKFADGHFIMKPVYFMDNIGSWAAPKGGKFNIFIKGDTVLQVVAAVDIGRVSAAALLNPKKFSGMSLNFATDSITGDSAALIMSGAFGEKIVYEQVIDIPDYFKGYESMFAFFEKGGYTADIKECLSLCPGGTATSFAAFSNNAFCKKGKDDEKDPS
jgi:uncharacterized protein YbjT (DUF2867 family)